MSPSGLAILLGAGPVTGAGIARILAHPSHGNLAVALLSRSGDDNLAQRISKESSGGVLKAFSTDTSSEQLTKTFDDIKTWSKDLGNLDLDLAIFSVKHSHKTPFAEETPDKFGQSLQTYVTGAMVFSQLATSWMLLQKSSGGGDGLQKKGTLIFTGTLGSLRTNSGYAAYGAGRAGVRMLAQSLAREYSAQGIHVVHAVANGGITDGVDGEEKNNEDQQKVAKGEKMRAESVGKLYLQLKQQEVDLWVHELDMRPAAEKF